MSRVSLEERSHIHDPERDSQDMTEHVQVIATSVYSEFQRLITIYGPDVVETLMPIIVSVLSNLDDLYKKNAVYALKLETLGNDFDVIKSQYEKEKAAKKINDEKILKMDFHFEEEKKDLLLQIEHLESNVRNLELKTKHHNETITRYDEKIDDLKKENEKLYEKYTDLFKSHGDFLSKMRSSYHGHYSQSPNHLYPQNNNKSQNQHNHRFLSGTTSPSFIIDCSGYNMKMNKYEIASSTSTQVFEDSADDEESHFCDNPESIAQIFAKDREDMTEDGLGEDNKSNLDSEIETTDDEFAGIRKEIEMLVKENQELHDTKNALNVVKDDLISKLDSLTSENDIFREEIRIHLDKITDLHGKLSIVEEELRYTKLELNKLLQNDSPEVSVTSLLSENTFDQKTFSRSEMAVALQERNYFKEKFLELQDALLYTENMRIKKRLTDFDDKRTNQSSSIWKFFKNLIKSDDTEPISASIEEKVKNIKSRNDQYITKNNLLNGDNNNQINGITNNDKYLNFNETFFRFRMELDRSQFYTWSIPRSIIESNTLPKHLPIPVRTQKIFDSKDVVLCITGGYESSIDECTNNSPINVPVPDYFWCLIRTGTISYQYQLLQLVISTESPTPDLMIKYTLKLKFPTIPMMICEVPPLIYIIKGLNKLSNPYSSPSSSYSISSSSPNSPYFSPESTSPLPKTSPSPPPLLSQQPQSPTMFGKITKVHQTKLLISVRPKNLVGTKTLWFGCEKNQIIVYVLFDNNKMEGRMATLTIPGPELINVKYNQGRVYVLLKCGMLCLFTPNKDLNQWDLNQTINFDLTSLTTSVQSEPFCCHEGVSGDDKTTTESNNNKLANWNFQPITSYHYQSGQLWLTAHNSEEKSINWIFVFDLISNCVYIKFPVENKLKCNSNQPIVDINISQKVVTMEKLLNQNLMLISMSESSIIHGFDLKNFEKKMCIDLEPGLFDLIEPINSQASSTNNNPLNITSTNKPKILVFTHLYVDINNRLWLITETGLILILDTVSNDNENLLPLFYNGTPIKIHSDRIFISAHTFVKSLSCISLLTNPRKPDSICPSSLVTMATDCSSSSVAMVAIGSSYLNLNNTAADILSLSNYAVIWRP